MLSRSSFFAGEPVTERDIADVDHVQAGIYICRHCAGEEIQHDLAGGCRFEVAISHGRGGIHDDNRETGTREIQSNLLGQKFGTFICAGHFLK